MKITEIFKNNKWLQFTVGGCIVVLFYTILQHIGMIFGWVVSIWNIVIPLVLGIIVAYLINPISNFFERKVFFRIKNKSMAHMISVIVSIILVVAVVVCLLIAVVPAMLSSVMTLLRNFDFYISALERRVLEFAGVAEGSGYNLENVTQKLIEMLENLVGVINADSILKNTQEIGGSFTTFFIGCIFAIYFLMGKERLLKGTKSVCRKILKPDRAEAFMAYCGRCHNILLRYIAFSLLDALIVGAANAVFMVIFGMRYASLISVVVAVTNLAPTFGPIVGCVFGMFILLLIKPSWAVAFLIFTIIIQTIDGYIIKPKLFGNKLGVSGLLILIFIVLGGRIFGVAGILLSIPLAAIAQFTVKESLVPFTHSMRSESGTSNNSGKGLHRFRKAVFSGESDDGDDNDGNDVPDEGRKKYQDDSENR